MQNWIYPRWYGDYSFIQSKTNWTDKQCEAFYTSSDNANEFGTVLNESLSLIMRKYDCENFTMPDVGDAPLSLPNNCSAEYLAYYQWGSSEITMNPPVNDEDYFPTNLTASDDAINVTLSVTYWNVPNISLEPEYFFYSQFHFKPFPGVMTTPALNPQQVVNMMNNRYTYYGVGSTYNAKHLYHDYITYTYENPSAYMTETMVNWNLNDV